MKRKLVMNKKLWNKASQGLRSLLVLLMFVTSFPTDNVSAQQKETWTVSKNTETNTDIEYTPYTYKPGKKTASTADFELTATYESVAQIKDEAVMYITKLNSYSEEYKTYMQKAKDNAKGNYEIKDLYMIRFRVDNEKLQPQGKVAMYVKTDYKAYMFMYGDAFAINKIYQTPYDSSAKDLVIAIMKQKPGTPVIPKPEELIQNNLELEKDKQKEDDSWHAAPTPSQTEEDTKTEQQPQNNSSTIHSSPIKENETPVEQTPAVETPVQEPVEQEPVQTEEPIDGELPGEELPVEEPLEEPEITEPIYEYEYRFVDEENIYIDENNINDWLSLREVEKEDEKYSVYDNPKLSIINRNYINYLNVQEINFEVPQEIIDKKLEENDPVEIDEYFHVQASIKGKFDEIDEEHLRVISFSADDRKTIIKPELTVGEDGIIFEFNTKDKLFALVEARREIVLNYANDDYRVSVKFNAYSGIPANALLRVNELSKDSTDYEQYVQQSSRALGEQRDSVLFARAFDICLINPQTGEEYQPGKGVKVNIEMINDKPESMNVDVVHIHEEGKTNVDVLKTSFDETNVEFETPSFSVFVVIGTTLEKVIETTDENSYLVTLTYDEAANLPQNVTLDVKEITEDDVLYDQYMKQSSTKLGKSRNNFVFAKAFDISIIDADTGEKIEPNDNVRVSISLLDKDYEEFKNMDVVHFGEETEVMETTFEEDTITFESNSFSVYVVISHEGSTEIEESRIEFHYIDKDFTEIINGTDVTYTASPYNFLNKYNEYQTTQILANGESLEQIQAPSSYVIDNGDGTVTERFFYGWYFVNLKPGSIDNTSYNQLLQKWVGQISYQWTDSPKEVLFEQPLTITDVNGNVVDDITLQVGDIVNWQIGETTGQAEIDDQGIAHVYLAPMYEDFYFINFRLGPWEDTTSGWRDNLLTRRLIVFGANAETQLKISDIMAPSPDPKHKVFVGWQEYGKDQGDYYVTVDDAGNEVNPPYYLTLHQDDGTSSYNLYPVFAEARWLNYTTGVPGNGATYVQSQYLITNDTGTGKSISSMPTSVKNGYTFDGWYVNGSMDDDGFLANETQNQTVEISQEDGTVESWTYYPAIHITNGQGQFLDAVKGKVFYLRQSEVDAFVSRIYMADSVPTGQDYKKLFEITTDGKLFVYEEMEDLNLLAGWIPDSDTTFKVIVWKQKITDDKDALTQKYDYATHFTSNTVSSFAPVNVNRFSGSYTYAYETAGGIDTRTQTVNNIDLTNHTTLNNLAGHVGEFQGFHYARTDMQGTPSPDGTTIYNVYYDRDLMLINFYYYTYYVDAPNEAVTAYEYTIANDNSGTQYAFINGEYVELTYQDGKWMVPEYIYEYEESEQGTYGKVGIQYFPLLRMVVGQEERNTYTYDTTYYGARQVTNRGAGYYYAEEDTGILTELAYSTAQRRWSIYNFSPTTNNDVTRPYYALVDFDEDWKIYILLDQNRDNGEYWTLPNGEIYTGQRYSRVTGAAFSYTPTHYRITEYTDEHDYNESDPRYYLSNGELVSTGNYEGQLYTDWTEENIYPRLQRHTSMVDVYGYTYQDITGTTRPYPDDEPRYIRRKVLTGNMVEYTNVRFKRGRNPMSNYKMITWSGLYGQTLAHNGYSWDSVSEYYWKEDNNTGQTYLDAFIRDENPYNLTTNSRSGSFPVYHYRQGLDGKYRISDRETAYLTISSGSTNFNLTDKFEGYTVHSATVGTNSFNENGGTPGSDTVQINSYSGALHVYHTRNTYQFEFDVNYPTNPDTQFSNGKSENMNEIVKYEMALSVFGRTMNGNINHWYYGVVDDENEAQYELKAPDNYIFGGWYEDATCQVAFNFSQEMTNANRVVYAKWTPQTFWLEVDPNGAEIDHIDHRGYADYNISEVFRPSNQSRGRQATYSQVYFGDTVPEYQVARNYIPISASAATSYTGQLYYYFNTQKRSTDGINGLHTDLRNALYIKVAAPWQSDDYEGLDIPYEERSEVQQYYALYKAIVQYELTYFGGENEELVLLDFETWKRTYLTHTDPTDLNSDYQYYRAATANESYVFQGWFEVYTDANGNETGIASMPYEFGKPIEHATKIRAMWSLNGGYNVLYHSDYSLPDGSLVNGAMDTWIDPQVDQVLMSYADGARTTVYKAPYEITVNGEKSDEVIFRGWRLVSVSYDAWHNPTYTPMQPDTYYDPGAAFTIHAGDADMNGYIHMQAVYELKDQSYRRPEITNLILDANGGYITDGQGHPLTSNMNIANYTDWNGVGRVSATKTYTDENDVSHAVEWIEFGDFQSNKSIHLYRYATDIININGDPNMPLLAAPGTNYFGHPQNYLLIGFDDAPNEGDGVATYTADSVIAVTRNERRTLYAVWEPMVYINFVNNSQDPVHLKLSSTDTLTIVDTRNSLFGRIPMSADELANITVEPGAKRRFAIPNGDEKTVKIEVVNDLGVGKVLKWDSSLKHNNVTYDTAQTGANIEFTHAEGDIHILPKGSAKATETKQFEEKMLFNPDGITVTFTSQENEYALLLDENHVDGDVQEIDFTMQQVNDHESALLPDNVNRSGGYEFLGWAYEPDATTPDYAADRPDASMPWNIPDLYEFYNNTPELHKQTQQGEVIDTNVATLYAVWDINKDEGTVYVYNEVPSPGNKNADFHYFARLSAKYYYGSYSGETLGDSYDFWLKDGEHAVIASEKSERLGYVKAKVTVYDLNGDVKDEYEMYDQANRYAESGTFNGTERVDIEQEPADYYSTNVSRTAQTDGHYLYLGDSTDVTTLPFKLEDTNKAHWTDFRAGGTIVFENVRDTHTVTVKKVLNSATSAASIFNYTYSYYLDDDSSHTTTGTFSVTSGDSGKVLDPMPAGAVLTITESNDGSYAATMSSASGTPDANPADENAFSFTVARDETITFTNTLKAYSVRFIKVDQDMQPNVNATFSMVGPSGSLGTDLYAQSQATGGNGQFFSSSQFWVGDYILTEKIAPAGYEGLTQPVTIKVTSEGITCDDNHIKIEKQEDGSYIIYVINENIITLTIRKRLQDPFLTAASKVFTFKVEYNYTRNGATITRTQNVDVTSNNNLVGTNTIRIPANSRVRISEVLAENDVLNYDTTYTVTNTETTILEPTVGTVYDSVDLLTTEDSGNVITFFNKKRTTEVTITKDVTAANKSGTFGFVATLVGNTPIANYTIGYRVPSGSTGAITTDHTATTATTDENGKLQFTLKHEDSIVLEVPIGLRINLQENTMVGNSDPTYTLADSYAVLMNAFDTETMDPYAGRTTYNEDNKMFSVVSLPAEGVTIMVYNMSGPKTIRLKKTDTYGVSLGGAQFNFYSDYACTRPADIILTNGTKATQITSANSFTTVSGVNFNMEFKIIPGIYYMKETNTLTGYEENTNVYRLVVGDPGMLVNGIQLPEGQDWMIDRMVTSTIAQPDLTIKEDGILNIPLQKDKVIIKKTDANYIGLTGARLVIMQLDGTVMDEVVSLPLQRGLAYMGELPYGLYKIHETIVPSGHDNNGGEGWWYTLRVDEQGATVVSQQTADPVLP